LDVLASAAMIAAAAVILWSFMRSPAARSTPAAPVPEKPISFTGAASLGNRAATIGIIEFSDFECPFCARFVVETLPWLREKYIDRGLVRLVYRHLPLPNHVSSTKAALAADCAGRQGRFWEMHDHLFASPRNRGEERIRSHARAVGLDESLFLSCLADEAEARRLSVERDAVAALGISATPTFLIGTVQTDGLLRVTTVVAGARPVDEFDRVIAKLLVGR
jgi:protein-disulfide isomerase